MLRNIGFLLLALLLTGCVSSKRLGISEAEWQQMSEESQQKALADYNQLKKTYSSNRTKSVYAGQMLSVYFLSGKAMMSPFTRRYSIETTQFNISPGYCKFVLLRSIDTNHSVRIRVCYNGQRFSVDPSRYQLDKANGTVHFDYNPIWRRGFTYSDINTSGYVQLKDASISIKAVPADLIEKYAKYNRS